MENLGVKVKKLAWEVEDTIASSGSGYNKTQL
jgi:hypothetical protein